MEDEKKSWVSGIMAKILGSYTEKAVIFYKPMKFI